MNPRHILVALLLALLVSGGCAWLIGKRLVMSRISPGGPEVKYVAASRPLHAGEAMSSATTELVVWPSSIPIVGAFSRMADVEGREVLFPLAKDQPILDRDLAPVGSGTGLASKIPKGMRAVALRSDEIVGVAGFLAPGSHLDVLVTYRADASSEPLTATVIQNAIVIAAGHEMEPDPSGKSLAVTVVTLLLTPEEAERAVLAGAQGAIHFILRNGGDDSKVAGTPILLSQLSAQSPAAGRPVRRSLVQASPQTPPRPVLHEIETVLAGDSRALSGQGGGGGR